MIENNAAYAWILTPDQNWSVFFPLHDEDFGKQEKAGQSDWVPFVPGMLGNISGMIENIESPFETVIRESEEERRIRVAGENVSNGFQEVQGSQKRSGREINFSAVGCQLVLTDSNLEYLKTTQSGLQYVSHDHLPDFLVKEARLLRPFIRVAGWEIIKRQLLVRK